LFRDLNLIKISAKLSRTASKFMLAGAEQVRGSATP